MAMLKREPVIYRLFPRSHMCRHSDLILRDCDDGLSCNINIWHVVVKSPCTARPTDLEIAYR